MSNYIPHFNIVYPIISSPRIVVKYATNSTIQAMITIFDNELDNFDNMNLD